MLIVENYAAPVNFCRDWVGMELHFTE